jgi:hypothetical protein
VDTRFIDIGKLQPWEEQAWNSLAEEATEPNPFFEPGFLALASRHFDGFSRTRLLVAQEGRAFKGLIPIVGVERARVPPRRTTTTRANPTMVSAMCTPLVDRTCVDQAIGALLEGLRGAAKCGDLPGIVSLKRVGDDGPVVESLHRKAGAAGLPIFTKDTYERGVVTRSGKWANPLSGSRRREIGRRRRLLERDTGSELLVVDRTKDPAAVADFLTIEASGWKGQGLGMALALDPRKVAWFHEWYAYWTETGRLTVLALNLGDTSIAMQYFIRAGDGIFVYRVAHDAGYPKYGLGQMLFESAMELLYKDTDAEWMDACTDPDNAFFLAMLPERRTTSMLLIGTGGLVDRACVSAMPTMSRVVAAQRQARQRWARSDRADPKSKDAG